MNAFKNLGLRLKIFLLLTASSLLSLFLACASFVYFNHQFQRDQVQRDLIRDAEMYAAWVDPYLDFDDIEGAKEFEPIFEENPRLMGAVVYHLNGDVFFRYERRDQVKRIRYTLMEAQRISAPGTASVLERVFNEDKKQVAWVFMLRDLDDVTQRSQQFIGIASAVLAVAFVIGLLVSLRLQRHITGPLLNLSKAVNTVARKKDYSIRANHQNDDEIGQLVDDFNEMVAQIQSRDLKLQNVNEMLEDKVHERTAKLEEEVGIRREAERALYNSQQKLLMHVQQTPLGVIDWNLDEEVVSWNPAAEEIFGWKMSEVIGRNWREFLVPDAAAMPHAEASWKSLRDGTGGTHTIDVNTTKNGAAITCEWFNSYLVDEEDNVIGFASLVQDITQRMVAEEALRQSEERFSKAFQASPAPIAILSMSDGRFVDVNENFVRLFGHDRATIRAKSDLELGLWCAEADRQRLFKLVTSKRSVSNFECPLKTATGSLRTTLLSAELVELANQKRVLLQVNDLTERMSLEEQLRQSQKMEAIGQLAAGVAHDFNNILTIISGHTGLLKTVEFASEEDSESVTEIASAADRAANLTRQLLAFSRKQVMQRATVDLSAVVSDSAKMLKRLVGETIDVETLFPDVAPLTDADIGMIEQIVLNLTVNARDAMPDGGKLTVRTAHHAFDEADVEHIHEAYAGQFVCLSVTDTGCGMGKETQARIFEPFFTTKEVGKGTGLGLATVYGIVKQHNGWIEVQSEVGKGTTFAIYFPAAEADSGNTARLRKADLVQGGDEGILLAEDEEPLRRMVSRTLKRYGYTVYEAEHGPQALEIWKAHRDKIQLLLTDMIMPEGLNGKELAEAIQGDRPDVKVIYTSGYTPELFGEDGEMNDSIVFLAKPYRMNVVADLVRQVLDGTNGHTDYSTDAG